MNHRLSIAASCASVAMFVLCAAAGSNAAPPPAPPAGDAAKGATLFLQCRACHAVVPGARNGVGPNLAGVVGAKAASVPGYSYSAPLTKAGLKWTPATLDAWLARPSAMVPGNKMTFAGMPDPKARANVIAYLATLKAK